MLVSTLKLLFIGWSLSYIDPSSSRVDNQPIPITMYEYGFGDLYNTIFYSLVWIIIHAIIHEYIWEVSIAIVYFKLHVHVPWIGNILSCKISCHKFSSNLIFIHVALDQSELGMPVINKSFYFHTHIRVQKINQGRKCPDFRYVAIVDHYASC